MCETVSHIPARIGHVDLLLTGVTAIEHRFVKWSKGMQLTVNDVTLRDTQWEELVPKGYGVQDVDVIADRLYKEMKGPGGHSKKRFDGGKKPLDIILALPYEKYDIAFMNSQRDEEEMEVNVNASIPSPRDTHDCYQVVLPITPRPLPTPVKGKGKRKAAITTEFSESETGALSSNVAKNVKPRSTAGSKKVGVKLSRSGYLLT